MAMVPCAMNLRVRVWMSLQCKIQNYLDSPNCFGIFFDIVILLGVGVAVVFASDRIPLFSGFFIGLAIGEVRILCSFKIIRDKL
jgi:hypothetical protein